MTSEGNRDKKMTDKELEAKFEEFMKQSLTTSEEDDEGGGESRGGGGESGGAASGPTSEKGRQTKNKPLWWLQKEEEEGTNKTKTTFLKVKAPTENTKTEKESTGHLRMRDGATGNGAVSRPEVTRLTPTTSQADGKTDLVVSMRARSWDETEETSEDVKSLTGEGKGGESYGNDFESERTMTDTNDDGAIGRLRHLSLSSEELQSEGRTVAGEMDDPSASKVEDSQLPSSSEKKTTREFGVRSVEEILKEAEEVEKSISRLGSRDSEKMTDDRDTDKVPSTLDLHSEQQLLREERRRNAKLSSDIQRQKFDFEERTFRLEEENIQLKARLEEMDGRKSTEEEERQIERLTLQTKEHERLIAGYQKENERLYKEVKGARNTGKKIKEKAEEDSRYLQNQLVRMKEDLDYKDVLLESRGDRNADDLLKSTREQLDAQKAVNERLSEKLVQMEEAKEPFNEATELKKRIVALEREVRDKNMENRSLSGVVETQERKVTQLRKQVKQLESLLQVRNPNSISALVLAAGVAGGTAADGSPRIIGLLEQRVRDLDSQLVKQTTDGSHSFEALQDQFNLIKDQYKTRVEQLERQLARSDPTKQTLHGGGGSSRPQTTITALEIELESVRERHRREVEKLRGELDALQRESKRRNAPFKDGNRVSALNARIQSLVSECNAKERCMDELRKKVEVMEKCGDDKDQRKVHDMSPELEQLRYELKVAKGRSEESRKAFEESQAKLSGLVSELNSKLNKTTSRLLEVNRKCETQEMVIDNVKKQLSDATHKKEEAENEALRVRRRQLKEQACCAQALRDPKLKDFVHLQARVLEVERRYREKSEELRRIAPLPNEMTEADKWKGKFYARNLELEKFRSELDDIIHTLEELQQGINP